MTMTPRSHNIGQAKAKNRAPTQSDLPGGKDWIGAESDLDDCLKANSSFESLSLKKVKSSPYLITERRVPELIPVLGSQPAGDVSHKPDGRLPLLSARPATLKRAATNFAAW